MSDPIRIQLSRRKGFSLQTASLAANGLPARKVTRPGLFGNPFELTPRTTRLGMIVLRNRIRANLHHLRGYNLACFCPVDEPCHCDVYLDLLKTDWPERWKAKYPKICEEIA